MNNQGPNYLRVVKPEMVIDRSHKRSIDPRLKIAGLCFAICAVCVGLLVVQC